jgi:hypothetical protein
VDLAKLIAGHNPPFTRLDPSLPARDVERNIRWRLWMNTDVEGEM